MNYLSNNIYAYYVTHFTDLPFDKQLHFASRLYLWSGDPFGAERLVQLRPQVAAHEDPSAALRAVYEYGQATIHHGSKNAAELRAPYFQKYPQLRTVVLVLFRLTFLQSIYDIDARETFFDLFDKTEVEKMLAGLLGDTKALAILSTHAINALYLYHRVVLEDDHTLDPHHFLAAGKTAYDLSNPLELQLFIYLYTHCIIGESRFYARQLPEYYLSAYQQMARELEAAIDEHFTTINLDNKFEFLVCCRLVGFESKLADRIEAEAALSVSDEGTFLVDRHNTNPQATNSTLELSEHRNVLYILAHRDTKLAR